MDQLLKEMKELNAKTESQLVELEASVLEAEKLARDSIGNLSNITADIKNSSLIPPLIHCCCFKCHHNNKLVGLITKSTKQQVEISATLKAFIELVDSNKAPISRNA